MTWDEYQAFVYSIASEASKVTSQTIIDTAELGLIGETGELTDHIKKFLYHGHKLDEEYIKLELGDLLWYATFRTTANGAVGIAKLNAYSGSEATIWFDSWSQACKSLAIDASKGNHLGVLWHIRAMADELSLTLNDIRDANVAKLRKRYPEGFTTERSINREEGSPESIHQPS